MSLHPSDLRAGDWVHLAEIDYDGRTLRFAEAPVTGKPWGDLSASVDFLAGLDIGSRFDREIDLFADVPPDRTLRATVDMAGLLDYPSAALSGRTLVGTAVRVYLHPVGTTARFTVFQGVVTEDEFGEKQDPVSFSAASGAGEDFGRIHGAFDSLRAFDVVDVDAEQIDTLAPAVFGAPGDGTLTDPEDHFYGTPAFGLRQSGSPNWLLYIANTRTAAGEAGEDVYFWNVTKDTSGYVPAMLLADDTGTVRTVADMSSETPPVWDNGDEIWIDWNTTGGGIARPGGEAIRGAGDVLFYLMSQVRGVDMDLPRIKSIAPLLNVYKIDAAAWDPDGEHVSPLAWAQEYILPFLPISMVDGEGGAYFVLWRPDAGTDDAVTAITVGVNASRASDVESSSLQDVYSDITLKYGVDAKTDKPTRIVRVTGSPAVSHVVEHARIGLYAQRSQQAFGERIREPFVAASIWDNGTANLCLNWLERRYAMPSHAASYSVRPDLAWLQPGDVVTLTDTSLGLSERVCLVEVVSPDRSGETLVRLRLYAEA